MRRICTLCERTAHDSNLMCTELECPLKTQRFLGSGQLVGDVTVVSFITNSRTASFYEGQRGGERVLLKVAFDKCEEQLRGEAQFLAAIAQERAKKARPSRLTTPPDPFPGMPNLLPAYQNASVEAFPYGQSLIDGKPVFFEVMDYVEGIPLREYLVATPTPWFFHVGYVVARLAKILALMNKQYRIYHANLNSESVWVHEDKQGYLRPMLMDYGATYPLNQPISDGTLLWLRTFGMMAYLPPEIATLETLPQSYSPPNPYLIDGYSLGLLLYEMLAGTPKYSYRLRRNSDIIELMRQRKENLLTRDDIKELKQKPMLDIAKVATNADPAKRVLPVDNKPTPLGADVIAGLLETVVGKVPAEPSRQTIGQNIWRAVLVASLLMVLVLLLGVAFAPPIV